MDYLDAHNRVTLRIYGTIKGIKFYGNVAMLWGEVQSEFYVDIFGPQVWKQIMIVTDNGEGKKTVPDRVSNPWLTNDVWWPGEFDLFWGYTAEQFLVEMPINLGGTGSDYPLDSGEFPGEDASVTTNDWPRERCPGPFCHSCPCSARLVYASPARMM